MDNADLNQSTFEETTNVLILFFSDKKTSMTFSRIYFKIGVEMTSKEH